VRHKAVKDYEGTREGDLGNDDKWEGFSFVRACGASKRTRKPGPKVYMP
jgi:hypothetical protein